MTYNSVERRAEYCIFDAYFRINRLSFHMTIPSQLKEFLSSSQDISIGYSEITFLKPESLSEGQIGYSIDENGNSLVGEKEGEWKSNWMVIAYDNLGDPIFIDSFKTNPEVFSSQHGQGIWETTVIADSLANFKLILTDLKSLSKNRTYPTDLERNPLHKKEIQTFISKIEKNNPQTEAWFWETFLEFEN